MAYEEVRTEQPEFADGGAIEDRLDAAHLEVDRAAMATISSVYRAASAIRRHVEQTVLAASRLSWTGYTAMFAVWVYGEMETRHLAAQVDVAKGTLTGVLDTLEGRGLVTRRRHADDRRQVSVALTAVGEQLVADVLPKATEQATRMVQLLSASEQMAITTGLSRLVECLPQLRQDDAAAKADQ
ncbi:MAG TPA: MarR family winged helix-turn-helix transcriptional regulator [Egibacteraceae bacterium]|nr:MarR family winged helix-turn-helix transcriptional regulator [Egibacteraceae bacterium]